MSAPTATVSPMNTSSDRQRLLPGSPVAARLLGSASRSAARALTRLPAPARRAAHAARRAADLAADRAASARASNALGPRHDERFEVVVHFAGDSASAYQLTQWLWPLEQLAEHLTVGIVCRSARTAQELAARTHLPVRFGRRIADLDAIVGDSAVRCVLYVNQATQNFHALRYPRPAHVHLSHGESEKSSMVSNQLKAYDYVLTAGQAARDRIAGQLIGFSDDRMIDVGRPQLDAPAPLPQEWADHLFAHPTTGAPVVFWAPTWEGDSPSMAYGTLPVSGRLLAQALITTGAHILYRPHPRTGFLDPQFREADAAVRALVQEAGGFVDTTASVGWQFAAADACIAEMSSVAFDWLATGKPIALIRPKDPHAEIVAGGLFDRIPSFTPEAIPQSISLLLPTTTPKQGNFQLTTNLGSEGTPSESLGSQTATSATHYLGCTRPDKQIGRFTTAIRSIVERREIQLRGAQS